MVFLNTKYIKTAIANQSMVTVHIDRGDQNQVLEFTGKAGELCRQLQLNPEEVLVVSNGELLMADDLIADSDIIHILYVLSGG